MSDEDVRPDDQGPLRPFHELEDALIREGLPNIGSITGARPTHPDFDALSAAVQLNDERIVNKSHEEVLDGYCDGGTAGYVALQRALRIIKKLHIDPNADDATDIISLFGAAWLDGFIAACHFMQQSEIMDRITLTRAIEQERRGS